MLAGALAISIIPAEYLLTEPVYGAAFWENAADPDKESADMAEAGGDTMSSADELAPEAFDTEYDGMINESGTGYAEGSDSADLPGEDAAPGGQEEPSVPEDAEPEDESESGSEEEDSELQVVIQFTEDYDHISGDIIPVIWNETDEARIVEENDFFREELVGAASLPTAYVTETRSGIRNQKSQRCWLHSMTTSAEMSMIEAGLADSLDYSERQIAYWFFNQTEGDNCLPANSPDWKTAPGSYLMATAAVARQIGLADEASYPSDETMESAVLDNNISHIEKVLFLGSWPVREADWKGNSWKAMNTSVKAAVKEYGAVAITYYSGYSSLNRTNYGFYTPWPSSGEKREADHSVTVIGWDDTKVVRDDVEPGAFYVQNSWGKSTLNTENGYNWISYYDSSLGTASVFVPEHEPVGTLRDEDVFFYTGTGYMGTSLSGVNQAGNIFTADVDEIIDSVGFYSYGASSYNITVVKNLADYSDPGSGTVAATASGTTESGGFFKVPLKKAVSVNAGDKFAVLITMHGINDQTFRALFEGPSKTNRTTSCEEGQSFILIDEKYYDCGKDSVSIKKNGQKVTYSLKEKFGNVCVYAYGNPKPIPQGPFPDVPYDHAYASAIAWAVDRGITKGYSATGLFGLDDTCTRGQIMRFLWNYAGKPEPTAVASSPFSDVPKTHTFYKAILWGSQKGITKGYSNGKFGVNDYCTRGQIMTFIWRYKGSPKPKSTKNPFKDSITAAYLKAVIWAYEKGVTRGFSDGTYRDKKQCTRGEAVKFLHNMYLKT